MSQENIDTESRIDTAAAAAKGAQLQNDTSALGGSWGLVCWRA